jgi:pyruvate formate lyase activating enzyme
MLAPVNNIINFSNVDGPGNRMSIFFQKCPNKCLFCHNPETINMCINCGDCIETCPVAALKMVDNKVIWDKNICINCDTCIRTCKYMSSPKITYTSVDDLFESIKKRQMFIKGITVSGGESMEYPEFLLELFKKVKSIGLTCLIDSSGYYNFKDYPELLAVCDGIMLDVKAYNNEFYKFLTGNDNKVVLENLVFLLEQNKLEEVRTVIFPNHQLENEETFLKVGDIINNKVKYKLLKYRPYGVRLEGLEKLGKAVTKNEEVNRLQMLAKAKKWENIVII